MTSRSYLWAKTLIIGDAVETTANPCNVPRTLIGPQFDQTTHNRTGVWNELFEWADSHLKKSKYRDRSFFSFLLHAETNWPLHGEAAYAARSICVLHGYLPNPEIEKVDVISSLPHSEFWWLFQFHNGWPNKGGVSWCLVCLANQRRWFHLKFKGARKFLSLEEQDMPSTVHPRWISLQCWIF